MNTLKIVYITAEVVVGMVSVIGNTVVLTAVIRTRQLHTVTNVFVAGLALADIAVGLLVAPLAALSFEGVPRHFFGCVIINCLILLFTNVSILMLLAIAMERFLAIKQPYLYQSFMTVRRAVYACIGVWLLGTFLGLVPVYWNSGYRELDYCEFTKVITYEYMVYFQFFALVILPLCLMLIVYTYILVIVRRHMRQTNALRRQLRQSIPNGNETKDAKERRKFNKDVRAAKAFALVILMFAFCWLPVNLFNCVSLFCGDNCPFPYESLLAAIVLSHANSSVNPFLYAASNTRIRRAMKRLFGSTVSLDDSTTDANMGNRCTANRQSGDENQNSTPRQNGGIAVISANPGDLGLRYGNHLDEHPIDAIQALPATNSVILGNINHDDTNDNNNNENNPNTSTGTGDEMEGPTIFCQLATPEHSQPRPEKSENNLFQRNADIDMNYHATTSGCSDLQAKQGTKNNAQRYPLRKRNTLPRLYHSKNIRELITRRSFQSDKKRIDNTGRLDHHISYTNFAFTDDDAWESFNNMKNANRLRYSQDSNSHNDTIPLDEVNNHRRSLPNGLVVRTEVFNKEIKQIDKSGSSSSDQNINPDPNPYTHRDIDTKGSQTISSKNQFLQVKPIHISPEPISNNESQDPGLVLHIEPYMMAERTEHTKL